MREVKLTDEQIDNLEIEWLEIESVDDILASLVTEVAKRKGKLKHEYWQTVRALAGCAPHEGKLKFDPIAGSIRVYETDATVED